MNRNRILLMAILIGLAAYWYYDTQKREEEELRRQYEQTQAAIKKAEIKKRGVAGSSWLNPAIADRPDFGMQMIPPGFQRTVSEWDAAERKRIDALFPSNSFDVLVVPFQVRDHALDRTTRSLMSAQLAQGIRASGARVPDTYLLLRALGESERTFAPEVVYPLAQRLGVTRIVWSFVGHDRANKMSVLIRAQQGITPGYIASESMKVEQYPATVGFSDDSPPIVAFQAVLPGIIQNLGYALPAPARKSSRFDGATLPSSPRDMATEASDPALNAFSFLMLSALAPYSAERTRERFAEKAMLAVQSLSEEYPDYRLLRARAFMLMGLRPAALFALGQPQTAEEKALFGMLNGNLPDVIAETARIKSPVKRILAELDLAIILRWYDVPDNKTSDARVKSMALPGSVWPLFVARGLADSDGWAQFQNIALKNLLDAEFPIQGYTAEGIVSGAATVADPVAARNSADFSVHNHIRRLIGKEPGKVCCNPDPSHLSAIDYLDLMDAIGFDNLARQVHFYNYVQGRPNEALALLARYEAVYKGHPHLSILRAEAESNSAARADSAAKEGILKSAFVDAFNTFYWEQGQTHDAERAFSALVALGRTDYGGYVQNLYVTDYPFRSYYPSWEQSVLENSIRNLHAALANSTFDTNPIVQLHHVLVNVQQKYAEFGEILKEVDGRFAGNTGLIILRAKNDLLRNNLKAAEEKYREAIRIQPSSWEPYQELSEMILRDGHAAESAKLVMRYPGFGPKSTENKISVSNHANRAGSNYFWTGHFDLAKPLLRISANLHTGAASDISSEIRLNLLAGDYAGALMGTYARASRYNTSYAYRDYLGFLHAMGLSKEAWDGFNALVTQQGTPHIWEAALVGHRKSAASEQEIFAWVKQDSLRNAGSQSSYAAMYLLRAAVIDRVPSESTAASIAEIDRKVWKVADGYDHVVRPSADGSVQYVLGPIASEGSTLPLGIFAQSQKVQVKSDLVYFAEAYRLMRAGKHDAARSLLEEAVPSYDLSQPSLGYMLPYLAFAAAKSGNLFGIEKRLATFRIEQHGFDFLLAQAVIAGLGGRTDDSMILLKKARYQRPFTEMRPLFSEYQYSEIIEWLYEETGKEAYRDLVLDWTKICERTQPWFSWAYAMEAKLSRDGMDRRRAIAMAYYLDRNSERLKSVPKREINEAVREFGRSNPFLKMPEALKEHPA